MNVSGPMPIVAEAYLDRLVDTNTLPWIEHEVPLSGGTGTQAVKLLHADPATGAYAMLARYPKGLVIPRHKHLAPAHSWILQGAWRFEEPARRRAGQEINTTSGAFPVIPYRSRTR